MIVSNNTTLDKIRMSFNRQYQHQQPHSHRTIQQVVSWRSFKKSTINQCLKRINNRALHLRRKVGHLISKLLQTRPIGTHTASYMLHFHPRHIRCHDLLDWSGVGDLSLTQQVFHRTSARNFVALLRVTRLTCLAAVANVLAP